MCGIAGIISRAGQSPDEVEALAHRMTDSLAHRGPDDWGVVRLGPDSIVSRSMNRPSGETADRHTKASHDRTIVLGHRRLAIIDLSVNGHQPMRDGSGRFWMVLNGEIYNYRELRADLESQGVKFRSSSDTEVLLALFAREGTNCLQKLRGMFAFAIWDEDRRELFLARDRFGIKPLYYAHCTNGSFVFASELKAILASGLVQPDFDEQSEEAFLERGSIAAPQTAYRGVKSLQPGCSASLSENNVRVEPYWTLSESLAGASGELESITAAAHPIRESLVQSVQAHMVSDVPVGLFLSGGLDSTAILASIRQFHSGPLRTYSIVFPGTEFDEGALARLAAQRYETDHTEVEITKDAFLAGLDEIFSVMDQPTIDGVNTYFVAKSVSEAGGKVALSGLGGDEVLGGYKSFVDVPKLLQLLRKVNRTPLLAKSAGALVSRLPAAHGPKLASLLNEPHNDLESVWRGYRAVFTDQQIRDLGMTVRSRNGSAKQPDSEMGDAFWRIARLEMERFMIPQLLRDSDVFTMCHALELRTPFVDHIFLQSVASIGSWPSDGAPSHKLALFRQMNGFLPPEHLGEPKRGFVLPFENWLRDALASESTSLGKDLHLSLSKPAQRSFVEGFVRGRVHWSRVWALYVLERFKRNVSQVA